MHLYNVLFLLWFIYVVLWLLRTFSAHNRRKE
jgi:hypothetical protein